MKSTCPEWLKEKARFIFPEIEDSDKWEYRTSFINDACETEVNCIHCGVSPKLRIHRPEPPKGEILYGVSYCSNCNIVYWFELV